METTKYQLWIFLPAILLAAFGFFIEIIRYQPLYQKEANAQAQGANTLISVSSDDPVIGDPRAIHTLVAFEDFGCASCASQNALLDALIAQYPRSFKWVWKGLPISQSSERVEDYGYCANRQGKFNAWKKAAFSANVLDETGLKSLADTVGLSSNDLAECLARSLPADHRKQVESLAGQLNIQGTPTFFLDNAPIATPSDIGGWKAILHL